MKNYLTKGDFVSYYNGGYTGRYINEDGDMDICDWHVYSSGKVLCVHENDVLVMFYSQIDESHKSIHNMLLNEIFVDWVYFENLTKETPRNITIDQDLGDYPDGSDPYLYDL